jgi:hypothetical protein
LVGIYFVICWATSGTLLFSVFKKLNYLFILPWWFLGLFILFCFSGIQSSLKFVCQFFSQTKASFFSARISDKILWVYVGIVLTIALVMAVFSPPNNNDSMIYHLPRQILWMSNQSVFISEAPNIFMLKWPPLSEYMGVNLWILSDSDRFHNLVHGACCLHAWWH